MEATIEKVLEILGAQTVKVALLEAETAGLQAMLAAHPDHKELRPVSIHDRDAYEAEMAARHAD